MKRIAEWILSRFQGEHRKRGLKILKVLIWLLLAFIVCNSMIPGQFSESETQSVAYFIFRNSEVMNVTIGRLPWVMAHSIIRKIGHFSEYACLAMLKVLYETARIQQEDHSAMPSEVRNLAPGALAELMKFGILTGLLDESIQLITPGRWGSVMDIWIDSLGFAIGILVTWGVGKLLVWYVQKRG